MQSRVWRAEFRERSIERVWGWRLLLVFLNVDVFFIQKGDERFGEDIIFLLFCRSVRLQKPERDMWARAILNF